MRHVAAVLLAVMATLSLHAALGPGTETPVAPPSYGGISGSQTTLAVATDGTDFLALWRDETPGRDGIYATVLSDNGGTRPLAPVPLIRGAIGVSRHVSVVWTGNSYLVALTRYLEPSFVLSLNRDGEIASPLRTVDLGGSMGITAMAWNGSRVLALARDESGTTAVLLDAEGNVVRSGIQLPGGVDFRVEAAGDAFIAVWVEQLSQSPLTMRARAARVSATGKVSAPVPLTEPLQDSIGIETASNGTEVGVVARTGSSADTVIYRATIDAELAVSVDAPLSLEQYASSNVEVSATSRGFVATYFAINNAQLKTVAFGFTRKVGTIDLPWSPGYGVTTVSNGRAIMAFWGIYPARAAAFDASLTRVTSGIIAVPRAPVAQDTPVIAGAGGTGLAAWLESGTLKLRRLDRHGNPLDAQPVVIASNVGYRPAMVFTGQLWLIAFVDITTGIRVQRMSPEGALLGEPMTLDIPTGDVAIAWNGNVAALVMTSSFRRIGLSLVRFSAAGERMDASPIVLTGERSVDDPAIASNGDGFLAVWSQSLGRSPRLQGKRLDASGNPIDAEPIGIANRSEFSESAAQVASNGTDYVVAYVQYGDYIQVDPPSQDDPHPDLARIYTKRVLATGVLADKTEDQEGTFVGLGTFPAIVFDGERYVMTFRKDGTHALWLFAAPLDGHGVPLTAPRLLLRVESYVLDHGLATFGGTIRTTYSRVVPELTNVHRVFLGEVTEQQARRRGSRN
jgi:large repetitive protein